MLKTQSMQFFQYSPTRGIDLYLDAKKPFHMFSPFYVHKDNLIPVPGMDFALADSVQGIWEALKLVNGQIDLLQLWGKPKRRKKQTSFKYQGAPISEDIARKVIFAKVYTYHAINNALPQAAPSLTELLRTEGKVTFTDKTNNSDIDNIKRPYSHAHLLHRLLNVHFEARLPINFPDPGKPEFDQLVEATTVYSQGLGEGRKHILEAIIRFAYLQSTDPKKYEFAMCMVKEMGIEITPATPTPQRKPINASKLLMSKPEN